MVYVQQISNRIRKEYYVGALIFKILGSHYIFLVWRPCDEPKPSLASPCEFGWRSNNDAYGAVTTKELPAPEALI